MTSGTSCRISSQRSSNYTLLLPSLALLASRRCYSISVHKSSGHFIFASTIVKYVASTHRLPTASLDVILGLRPSNVDAPFAELDELYINILSSVSDKERTLAILGFLMTPTNLHLR